MGVMGACANKVPVESETFYPKTDAEERSCDGKSRDKNVLIYAEAVI